MEAWKDKVISSIGGIERATPPADTFKSIQRKLNNRSKHEEQNQRLWLAIAAVILMVICSDVILLSDYLSEESLASYSTEYSAMITSYNLYDNEY